jgi:divalent metal cation (Fe/Co/Zn/Cd) transporter
MSIIMTVAGLGFAYTSLGRLMTPVPVWYFTKYAVIIGLTCIVKLFLGLVFTFRYKKVRSAILKTVMLDSYLDFAITVMTLVSFTLSNVVGFAFDAVFGLLISVIIAILGIRLIISSVSELLGQNNIEIEEKVINVIKNIDNNIVINSVSIHTYGEEKNHVTLNLSLTDKNDLMSVQNTIKNRLNTEINCISTIEWEVFS